LKEKVWAPVQKSENTAVGIRHADHVAPSIRKKLALASLTSGGRSVGIVRSRTKATEFSFIDTFSKWCVGRRGRVEECSVATLRNKRVKILCGCGRWSFPPSLETKTGEISVKESLVNLFHMFSYSTNIFPVSFTDIHPTKIQSDIQ
jgi:hypothetical protein